MPDHIGTAQIARARFEELLGEKAVQVWCVLVGLRNAYPRITVTVPGIAEAKGFAPLSERTVKRALRRLRQAGLVRDLGFKIIRGGDGQPVEIYEREVYGAFAGREAVLVPTDVWPKVMRMEPKGTHGGSRKGAGRRVGSRDRAPRQSSGPALEPARLHVVGTAEELQQSSGPGPVKAGLDPLPGVNLNSEATIKWPLGETIKWPTDQVTGNRLDGFTSSLREEVGGPGGPPALRLVPPAPAERLLSLYRRRSANPTPITWGTGGLPHHPGADVTMMTIPGPPRIPAYMEDREERLSFCVRWYRSAVESRGIDLKPIRLGGATRSYFEDALDVFLEKEIRPGAWVAWALDRILLKLPPNARKRFVPAVKQLLSPRLLTECRWQYREQESFYATPELRASTAGDELKGRMQALLADVHRLHREDKRDEAAVKGLVEKHFPEGFKTAVEATRANTLAQGQEVLMRMKAGHWLWPMPRALEGSNGRSSAA